MCALCKVIYSVGSATLIMIIGRDKTQFVAVYGTMLLLGLCFNLMCWISTVEVVQLNSGYSYDDESSITPPQTSSQSTRQRVQSISSSSRLPIRKILENKAAINLFMQRLIEEFSVELLCSYIEFHQFQTYLIDTFEITDIGRIEMVELPKDLVLPSVISSDETENKDDKILTAKHKAFLLHRKYTAIGSEYEINISGTMRDALTEFFFDD